MIAMSEDPVMADGVFALDRDGRATLVHAFTGGDYLLEDIVEFFQLGRLEPAADGQAPHLVLTMKDIEQLRIFANGFSFDYDEGFIEMCLDIHRFAIANPAERYSFVANF
ncbi:MAG TPA: hypothetical protein VF342_13645 [Alphaproteobacteria bacterium]